MDPTFLLFLALAALILILLILLGLLLLPRLMKSLGGRGGGWTRLGEHFPAPFQPEGEWAKRQTIEVGRVVYKNCATVGWSSPGALSGGKNPFFLPAGTAAHPLGKDQRDKGRKPVLEKDRPSSLSGRRKSERSLFFRICLRRSGLFWTHSSCLPPA